MPSCTQAPGVDRLHFTTDLQPSAFAGRAGASAGASAGRVHGACDKDDLILIADGRYGVTLAGSFADDIKTRFPTEEQPCQLIGTRRPNPKLGV